MLSSSLGAAVSSIQPAPPAQKLETNEEFAQPAQEQAETPPVRENAAPAVPATNGAAISIESVTALQQADDSAANNNQTQNAQYVQTSITEQTVTAQAAETVEVNRAEEPVANANGTETEESRQAASNNATVAEETDSAGRSVRNPLDLQI